MILTGRWRQQDVKRRLAVWEPLIGREATITATRSKWAGQAGALCGVGFAIEIIAVEAVAGLRSGPVVALSILAMVVLVVGFFAVAIRLFVRAQRQASLVAGTSEMARPPVTQLKQFQTWQGRSQYARRAQTTSPPATVDW